VTSSQADDRFGAAKTRWAIQTGRWQRPYRGVVVTHNGPLTPDEYLHVVVLAGPPGSVLSGHTAAALGGLRGFASGSVHLTIPHRARWLDLPGVVVHRSSILGDDLVVGCPARTQIERSVIDAAAWASTRGLARATVLASVQQRLTTPRRLLLALGRRGNLAGCAMVRESILDAAGGLESLPEAEFARLARAANLPEPSRQVPVGTARGRFRLDVVFDPPGVVVEIDGAHHRDPAQSADDMRRQNELVVQGRPILRFSSYEIRHEPSRVAAVLRRALDLPTLELS
jgi:very-short-patch-repair endonuclease